MEHPFSVRLEREQVRRMNYCIYTSRLSFQALMRNALDEYLDRRQIKVPDDFEPVERRR